MNFLLFAAGLGERLRPLTLTTPKPLLKIKGEPLLGRLLDQILPVADTVFINVCWLSKKIEAFINAHYRDANIIIIKEDSLLETGGSIINALDYEKKHQLGTCLGSAPFAVVNSDIYTDYDFTAIRTEKLANKSLAHLVLVDCPAHREQGDFDLTERGVTGTTNTRGNLVFSGIGIIRPELMTLHQQHLLASSSQKHLDNRVFSLSLALYYASSEKRLSGEHFQGLWYDIGTKEVWRYLSH